MHERTGPLAGLALSSLALSAAALAQDNVERYRFITAIDDQAVTVDRPSIVRDGDTRTYWTLWIPISRQRAAEMLPVAYHMTQFRTDCIRHTLQPLAIAVFNEAGVVLEATRPNRAPYQARQGGTHMQVVTYVCEGRAPAGADRKGLFTLAQMLETARRAREREAAPTPAP